MCLIEQIRESIVSGRSKETENRIKAALSDGATAKAILEDAVLPAMREVGESEEINSDIPRILSAARSVRISMELLEPNLQPEDGYREIGTVILGTVEGDLHDVGKNLVAIMFRSVGIHVVDLGVNVSSRQFQKAIKEHPEAKVVSMSSLLTTSLPELEKAVAAVRRGDKKGKLKIMVGGGAVTDALAARIGADAYTNNAVDAAEQARRFLLED